MTNETNHEQTRLEQWKQLIEVLRILNNQPEPEVSDDELFR